MFPHESALYNWTHRAFGGYWSFFVAFCAWFPCVILMIVASDVVVGYLQGLNPNWLVPFWQQGLVLVVILALSGVLALQPFSIILSLTKMTLVVAVLAVFLVGIAGAVWLLGGHASLTSFKTPVDWAFAWNPQGYYTLPLFGFICRAFLGIEVPLNMGGEWTGKKVITRHLFWGTLLVLIGYFVTTFGMLVVVGPGASGSAFALVTVVQKALGVIPATIITVLVICNFVVTPAVYSFAYSRLLFVGGIDHRLPVALARLNKHRIPANA